MWRGMNVSFRDMLFLLVFAYLVIAAIALANVAKQDTEASKSGLIPPGHITVEIWWPKELDDDVDLWVQGPGDVPVGYSNKSGIIFNLVRDDLGRGGDPNWLNYEVAYGRGKWAGEYVVNVMLYRNRDTQYPVPVTIRVTLQNEQNIPQQILQSTVELTFEGEETTVFRFSLDDKGNFIPNSVNRIHKDLRAAWSANHG